MDIDMSIKPIDINLSWTDRLTGFVVVIIAYIASRCLSMEMICKILRVAKHRCPREINVHEANIVWAAVRYPNLLFLGRLACLELSLAFVIFALTKGLSATWCVGVANQPFRSHAWVEIAGEPFREGNLKQDFRKLIAA